VAVDLGSKLTVSARRNLAGSRKVRVDVCAFEEWPLLKQLVDLVVGGHLPPAGRDARLVETCRGAGEAEGNRFTH